MTVLFRSIPERGKNTTDQWIELASNNWIFRNSSFAFTRHLGSSASFRLNLPFTLLGKSHKIKFTQQSGLALTWKRVRYRRHMKYWTLDTKIFTRLVLCLRLSLNFWTWNFATGHFWPTVEVEEIIWNFRVFSTFLSFCHSPSTCVYNSTAIKTPFWATILFFCGILHLYDLSAIVPTMSKIRNYGILATVELE